MKRKVTIALIALVLGTVIIGVPLFMYAAGKEEKETVTFFWALYDGLTEEFRAELQDWLNNVWAEKNRTIEEMMTSGTLLSAR